MDEYVIVLQASMHLPHTMSIFSKSVCLPSYHLHARDYGCNKAWHLPVELKKQPQINFYMASSNSKSVGC